MIIYIFKFNRLCVLNQAAQSEITTKRGALRDDNTISPKMSGFKALNVDSESEEEEIDDTKEMQMEDAFKLYQNALKLHSQGPTSYHQAHDAYHELFKSEVFKYPEAVSEFAHDQMDDDPPAKIAQPEVEPVAILPSTAADSSATSIPQIVYLSHKNRGEFGLDQAHANLDSSVTSRKDLHQHYTAACVSGLKDFAEALERDDTDIDLWKKAARVAEVLKSERIARFCFESALAGDDDGTEQTIDLSGLDEAFAAGQLDQVLKLLRDDLSLAHSGDVKPREDLLALLAKSADPYPFLPKRGCTMEYFDDKARPNTFELSHIKLVSDTVQSLGQEILQLIIKHQAGNPDVSAHSILSVDLPDLQQSPSEMDDEVFVDADEMVDIQSNDEEEDKAAGQGGANALQPNGSTHEGASPADATETNDPGNSQPPTAHQRNNSVELPTRKRSSTAAGNEEPEARARSKRLRARESMVETAVQEEEPVPENTAHQLWHWDVLQNADGDVFKVLDSLLTKLQIDPVGSIGELRAITWPSSESKTRESSKQLLHSDLGKALRSWTDDHSQALLNGHGYQDFVEKSAGLALFLQHTKATTEVQIEPTTVSEQDDLVAFVGKMDDSMKTLYDSVYMWLETVLTTVDDSRSSPYMRESWSEDFKQTVVQLLIHSDEYLTSTMKQHLRNLSQRFPVLHDGPESQTTYGNQVRASMELVVAIFELHIDILSRITNPSSQVQRELRIKQADRLERWAGTADDYMRLYMQAVQEKAISKSLTIRFLWATTIYAGKAENVDQAHIIQCLRDLKLLVQESGFKPISLPNNAAIPQISAAAAEQEISRLGTLDFFMSIFDNDNTDPVAVIEKLEPILERDLEIASMALSSSEGTATDAESLIQFLNSGDASLKLFLWRRLQNAYVNINYNPRVVSCLLRSIEVIVNELNSSRHAQLDEDSRQYAMLKWLKDIDELLVRILSKALTDNTAFDFLDADHALSSIRAISTILRLVHAFALNEASIRFGHVSTLQFNSTASARLWEKCKDRFREMQVHLWILQYLLLKDATAQYKDLFPDRTNDLADYLCTAHHALGLRHYCKFSNKQFVKLVKNELNSLETTNDYFADIAQVCFDLYDLKFKIKIGDFDHQCPSENLDKKTAVALIPTVMAFANRMDMKDLIKSDLKSTIDKVQAATGVVKAGKNVSHNKKLLQSYLRSPVIPEELYKAIKGVGDLPSRPIIDDSSVKAKYGWFFLLGHMTLAKYRSVKRVSPTPTDDLENASQYLQQDLHHDMEKWETWYRLAQVFEAKIEDDLIWNSTKLNDARDDIALLERNSIHCFTMAVAVAMRTADDNAMTAQKIGDLCREFAMRLYASSRAPLNMEAFRTDRQVRHLSSVQDSTMSKQPFHLQITHYRLWNFAAHLLKKKFTDKPKPWISHYTLAKCLWKMYKSAENCESKSKVTPQQILETIIEAIEALPHKDARSDPVLEPHTKLVSIVYKLVIGKQLTPQQGRDWLQATPYSRNIPLVVEEDEPDWDRYVLEVLKKLAQADKSNWHHRIVARRAHVIYDGDADVPGALGAKHELMQQVFTKTITYNVWKPENERPGRHYVYTGRYVLFFAQLLDQLNDRGNLDLLVRRVRRKQADFIDHPKIWESITTTYVKLLRRVGKIEEGKERTVFDPISHEEFTKNSERLESWAMEPDQTSVVLDIMRDAVELKKLNNSLAKGGYIDDLIGDAYASLYEQYVQQLPPEEQSVPTPAPLPQGTFINMTTEGQPQPNGAPHSTPQGDTNNASTPTGLGIQTPTHHFVGLPQPAAALPGGPTERAKPGRAKTVTKREIQRKADAMLVRPQPIKTPVLSKRPVIEIPVSSPALNGHGDGAVDARLDRLRGDEGDDSRASSRRGSVDPGADADNESELSDADEDGEPAQKKPKVGPLFPGLQKNANNGDNQSDADDDDNMGEDGEGLEGEDEEGDDDEGDENENENEGEGEDADEMEVDDVPEIGDSQEAQKDQSE